MVKINLPKIKVRISKARGEGEPESKMVSAQELEEMENEPEEKT